jgi:hypothetical protein
MEGRRIRSAQHPILATCESFDQMILPSLLALNADHRAIGGLHVGLPVQRHPDRKPGRRVVSNDLNAGDGLTPRPQTNCLKTFLPKSPVAYADSFEFHHVADAPTTAVTTRT